MPPLYQMNRANLIPNTMLEIGAHFIERRHKARFVHYFFFFHFLFEDVGALFLPEMAIYTICIQEAQIFHYKTVD